MDSKYFHIQLLNTYSYKKGDYVMWVEWEGKIVKVYNPTWWRKFLRRLGFKVRINQIKIECV